MTFAARNLTLEMLNVIDLNENQSCVKSEMFHLSKPYFSTNARVKGHLEPIHLTSSPLFTLSTKLLGQDSPLIHLFSKIIGPRFTTVKIKLGEDSPS